MGRSEADIMPWSRRATLLLVLMLLASALTARADDATTPPSIPSPITDHLALTAGFYWGHVNTFGQFNSGAGTPGTTLTAERDLGLTDQVYQPRIEIMFRLRQRGRLRVNFFDVRRNGEKQLDRTIQFGDQTFVANDTVLSTIYWRQMDLTYTYSFTLWPRRCSSASAAWTSSRTRPSPSPARSARTTCAPRTRTVRSAGRRFHWSAGTTRPVRARWP